MYAPLRSMRSQIQPPTTQPTAITRPPSTPVTSATVPALARQSPATADHRFEAAPLPIGAKHSASARNPPFERASSHRLRPTLASSCGTDRRGPSGAGSRRNSIGIAHARQPTASTAPGIQSCVERCAIHRPSPPPMPPPPRSPAWNQPPARPCCDSSHSATIRLCTVMPMSAHATFAATTTVVSNGRLAAVGGIAPIAYRPIAVVTAEIRYHCVRLSVMSAMGAHRNFHTCGT
jgi:hypothetical protein